MYDINYIKIYSPLSDIADQSSHTELKPVGGAYLGCILLIHCPLYTSLTEEMRMYALKRTQFLTSYVIFKYMKNGTFMQRYPAFDVVRDIPFVLCGYCSGGTEMFTHKCFTE